MLTRSFVHDARPVALTVTPLEKSGLWDRLFGPRWNAMVRWVGADGTRWVKFVYIDPSFRTHRATKAWRVSRAEYLRRAGAVPTPAQSMGLPQFSPAPSRAAA